MIHQRQRLTLRFETRHHLARVHTHLYELDGNAAANRIFLLGQPDLAHTALPYHVQEMIGTNHSSRLRRRTFEGAGDRGGFAVLTVYSGFFGHRSAMPPWFRRNTTSMA
jgi:hypothetical protein